MHNNQSHCPFTIECGRVQGKEKDGNWTLSSGIGKRLWTSRVPLSKPFSAPPRVFTSFALLDIVNGEGGYCISVIAQNITTTYFDVVVSTWDESVVWSAAVAWIAIDPGHAQGADIYVGREDFSKKNSGYTLHKQQDRRTVSRRISLPPNLTVLPIVVTGLSLLEAPSNDTDVRVYAYTNNVTTTHFSLNVETWSDTKIWAVSATWLAFPSTITTQTGKGGRIMTGFDYFKKGQTGFTLDAGSGSRTARHHKHFSPNFSKKPQVVSFLSAMDVTTSDDVDLRINTDADKTTASTCEVILGTWNDTAVWSGTATWLAFGETEYTTSLPLVPAPIALVKSPNTSSFAFSFASPSGSNSTSTSPNINTNSNVQSPLSPFKPPTKSTTPPSPITTTTTGHAAKKQKVDDNSAVVTKADGEDRDEDSECKICFDATINTVVVPCGHMCMCANCAEHLKKGNSPKCPVCNTPAQNIIKAFRA